MLQFTGCTVVFYQPISNSSQPYQPFIVFENDSYFTIKQIINCIILKITEPACSGITDREPPRSCNQHITILITNNIIDKVACDGMIIFFRVKNMKSSMYRVKQVQTFGCSNPKISPLINTHRTY